MKKVKLVAAALLLSSAAGAQTIYEAAGLIDSDLNGTARYVGMGGAMNALGGDVSVMRSNPAGIGLYRSNDLVFSFGTNTASTSPGTGNDKFRKTSFSFDNAAFVYAFDMGKSPVRFLNFGFNYNKRRNFNRQWRGNWSDGTTQTDLIARMASSGITADGLPGYDPEQFEAADAFVTANPYVGWLPIMGYAAYLINPVTDQAGNFDGMWEGYYPADSFDHVYDMQESGWINDYDFNVSLNVYDRVYLGMTLTAIDVKYQKSSTYTEEIYDGRYYQGGYDLMNTFSTSGSGLGFSIGIIARLTDNLRLGFSFATPTIYWLRDYQESTLSYNVDVMDENGQWVARRGAISPEDEYRNFMGYEYNYRVRTPWKVNVSLGATLLSRLAIGAEYEYQNAAKTSIMYEDGINIDVLNDGYTSDDGILFGGVRQSFGAQHVAKVGGEFRVTPSFSVRAGFNYVTSFMEATAFKYMEASSARTDTEYENVRDRWSVSAGLGYSKNHFYFDLAYQFMKYNSDFYPYDNVNIPAIGLQNREHQALLSVGFRF